MELMQTPITELQLEKLLDAEIELTRQLHTLLEEEKAALSERRPESLQELAHKKLQLLNDIEINHKKHASGDFRWSRLINSFQNPKSALLNKCEVYKALLEDVEYLNTVNAKTASRMQRSISELIKIIRGNESSQKLYTPKGSASLSNTYTSIAKA